MCITKYGIQLNEYLKYTCRQLYTVNVLFIITTVGPQLSESPLTNPRLSERYFEFLNPKIRYDFLQNQAINKIPV